VRDRRIDIARLERGDHIGARFPELGAFDRADRVEPRLDVAGIAARRVDDPGEVGEPAAAGDIGQHDPALKLVVGEILVRRRNGKAERSELALVVADHLLRRPDADRLGMRCHGSIWRRWESRSSRSGSAARLR
jgi:hypothetical protein